MVVLLSKTGLELIGWEVVPCRGKPWGWYWQLLLCVRCESRHHNLITYCLFPHYLWHFLVEMLYSGVMNDLCHGFLNPNAVYIFSSAYFGLIGSSFFSFLRCVYIFSCVGHRHVCSWPIQSSLMFCVWTLPTFFPLLGILWASDSLPLPWGQMDGNLEGGEEAGY